MAKVTINGEVFEFDGTREPMAEALAVEEALGCRYAQYQEDLYAGSAKALAAWIWLVWRRNGRDVPFADILSGAVDLDMGQFKIENEEAGEADPTGEVSPDPAPDGSPTTATGT